MSQKQLAGQEQRTHLPCPARTRLVQQSKCILLWTQIWRGSGTQANSKNFAKNLRSEDIYQKRFGGEEFMIIFSNTSPQIAQNVLERCRIAIEQHRIAYAEHEIQITASFG